MFQNEQMKKFEFDPSVTPHEEKTLSGHSGTVWALTVLSDGRLASGGNDKTIRLWNVSSGACDRTLSGHSSSIEALTSLPDGRLASGGGYPDNTIKLWNVLSGSCERTLSGHSRGVYALTLLSDGRLASGSFDNTIKLWNVTSGLCEVTLSGHSDSVRALTLLSDGRLASGSHDNTIKLWNMLRGSCEVTLSGHGSWVTALTLLSDGRLASGSWDKTIKLWNVLSGACEVTLSGHSDFVRALTLLSDGRLASGSFDNTIKLWNVSSGLCERTLSGHSNSVYALTVLSDGRLASGSSDNRIKLWNVGLTLKLTPPVAAARTSNPPQPAAATPGGEAKRTKNDQKDKNSTEKEKARESEQASREAALARREQELQARENQLLRLEQERQQRERQVAEKIVPAAALTIIPFSELTLQRELGRGGFGVVCEALWQGAKVAVKQLASLSMPEEILHEFKQEAEIHSGLKHPHVVFLYGVCLERAKYALVMELMTQGSLYDVLHNRKELPWLQRLTIASEIVAGLLFLHSRNILHRDLKSLNVLLDKNGQAKLSDFGLSKVKTHTASTTKGNSVGTLYWMAPELFDIDGSCSQASDIYALGMLFWEMASRKLPYQSANGNQAIIMRWVENNKREKIPEDTPPKFAQLISQCWAQRAEDRPTAQTIAAALASEQVNANSGSEVPTTVFSSGYQAFSR